MKTAQELPMSTVVFVIITIIAIAVLIVFAITASQSGKTQTEGQLSVATGAADMANCRLWAAGMKKDFCNSIACPNEIICDACRNGVEIGACILPPSGLTCQPKCP